MTKVTFISQQALKDMTEQQKDALYYMAGPHSELVEVNHGAFDLPDGYLTFTQTYSSGNKVYGGIAPDGSVST